MDVTVFTVGDYELEHLERNFHVHFYMKKSRSKVLLNAVEAFLRGGSRSQENITQRQGRNAKSARQVSWSLEALLMLRRWGTRLKAVCSFFLKRPHIIHFQWLVHPREDRYFIRLLQLLRFRIVYTAHNLLPLNRESSTVREAFQKIYRTVDRVIVHAEKNKKDLINEFYIEPGKISVIPHGSYDLFYIHGTVPKEVARRRLNIANNKKVILFFGGIRKNKGLEYLIDAFQEVKERIEEVMLLVAGKGGGRDEAGYKYYANLVSRLYSCDGVIFVEQYIPVGEVGHYFSAADVVVLPYINVYQSGVLLLAYAAGRPVVVTDTGGLGEVVEAGKSGFVVPPKDIKALAQAIITILQSADRIEEMSRHAQYLAETEYSWESIALKTIDTYQSLIR